MLLKSLPSDSAVLSLRSASVMTFLKCGVRQRVVFNSNAGSNHWTSRGHSVKLNAGSNFFNSTLFLHRIMRKVMGNKSSCPTQGDKVVELIYIDIVGLTQFKKTLGPSWVHYQ